MLGQGVWETRAPYPIAATEVSGVAIGGQIYCLCGITAAGGTNRMFRYDPGSDRWTEAAPVPVESVDHCNVAAVNGKLYLLGALRFGTSFLLDETFVYDPEVNRWSSVARMPRPRGASGVAVIGQRIYIAGGVGATGTVPTLDVFDTAAGEWSLLAPMANARDHLTAQAVDGRVFAIAGRNGGTQIAATEEYDPASNTWRARAPIPVARGGLGSGVIRGRIIVFGGEGPSPRPQGTYEENHEFDPVDNRWRQLAPMPTPRHGFYGVTLDERIFAASGGPRAGADFSMAHEVFLLPASAPRVDGAIRNAASFDALVAPNVISSLFGEFLSNGSQAAPPGGPVTRLNSVTVTVGNIPALLFFVSPRQINFLMPPTAGTGRTQVVVTNAGVPNQSPYPVDIDLAAPGIFAFGQRGEGQGAILVAGTGLLARASGEQSRAPRVGEAIEIYGTGYGAGATVTIGGVAGEVLFAGPAPGFPGLAQLNTRVPAGAAAGAEIPVRITMSGRQSNTVTMGVVE